MSTQTTFGKLAVGDHFFMSRGLETGLLQDIDNPQRGHKIYRKLSARRYVELASPYRHHSADLVPMNVGSVSCMVWQYEGTVGRYYYVSSRYGYSAVDEYWFDQCLRTTASGITRKMAQMIASACASAYEDGRADMLKEIRQSEITPAFSKRLKEMAE